MITNGCIYFTGDSMVQLVDIGKGVQSGYDINRCVRSMVYGSLMYTPFNILQYNYILPYLVKCSNPIKLYQAAAKTAIDFCSGNILKVCMYLYSMKIMAGGTHQEGVEKIKESFWTIYKTKFCVYSWLDTCIFFIVPLHL